MRLRLKVGFDKVFSFFWFKLRPEYSNSDVCFEKQPQSKQRSNINKQHKQLPSPPRKSARPRASNGPTLRLEP